MGASRLGGSVPMRRYRRKGWSGDMPKVEASRARIVKRLEQEGWTLIRHGGEHDVYRRGQAVVTVPRHRMLSPGVARSIAKAAGWL
jgi:predicted RNA binding protein YcfA (HicA-like mRNA interferase family)